MIILIILLLIILLIIYNLNKNKNFESFVVGMNRSTRNMSYDLRGDIPIQYSIVSPWNQSPYAPQYESSWDYLMYS